MFALLFVSVISIFNKHPVYKIYEGSTRDVKKTSEEGNRIFLKYLLQNYFCLQNQTQFDKVIIL